MPEIKSTREKQFAEVKLKKISGEVSWGIYNESFFIINNGTKEPYGILINDMLTAKTFEIMFEDVWNNLS